MTMYEIHYQEGEPIRVERHDGGFSAWVCGDGLVVSDPAGWGDAAKACSRLLLRERAHWRRAEKLRMTRLAND